MSRKLYRHVKSGNVYEVLSFKGKIEANWEDAVIYRRHGAPDSEVIARPSKEFFDGRFEPMGCAAKEYVFDPLRDIAEFHERFDLPAMHPMGALDLETAEFRHKFMQEELKEWGDHQHMAWQETTRPMMYRNADDYTEHLGEALDGLVDLAYVLFGTVFLHGFSPVFAEAWRRVHQANMQKVRATLDSDSTRDSTLDVVKPAGWLPPEHGDLVEDNDLASAHTNRK